MSKEITNEEMEILGFDPTQLSVFNTPTSEQQKFTNPNIYKMRPAEAKSEDGHYRATIKVVYNPHDLKHSVIDRQSYGLQDEKGFFEVVSSLTVNDKNCPIFKAWKQCHFSKDPILQNQALSEDKGGLGLFDKRVGRWVTVQILEDINHPELVGKFMYWKIPVAVWELIDAKSNPSKESGKAAIPVMDFLFGKSIEVEVTPGEGKPGDKRYARDTKYRAELSEDTVPCINPDGSPLLNDEEQEILDTYVSAIKKVWREKDAEKRAEMMEKINETDNTKQFREIYRNVINKLKEYTPNITEDMSFKPWSPEVTERVNNWISVVLAGKNPSATDPLASTKAPETTVSTPVDSTPNAVPSDDSELPF